MLLAGDLVEVNRFDAAQLQLPRVARVLQAEQRQVLQDGCAVPVQPQRMGLKCSASIGERGMMMVSADWLMFSQLVSTCLAAVTARVP